MMNEEVKQDLTESPKQKCWHKLKSTIGRLSKKQRILIGLVFLFIIIGSGYLIYNSINKDEKDNKKVIALEIADQIFSMGCVVSYENDDYYECEFGYETYSDNGLKEVSGKIDVGEGLNIISIESLATDKLEINKNIFKATSIKKAYSSVGEGFLIIKLEINPKATSNNVYLEIDDLVAKHKDGKIYRYEKILCDNVLNSYNNNTYEANGVINVFRYYHHDKTTFYEVNWQPEPGNELVYSYRCENVLSCTYDKSNLNIHNEILITDGDKVFSYNVLTEKTVNYDFGNDIKLASYSSSYTNGRFSKNGILVEYLNKTINYYSFKENKLIFPADSTFNEIELSNNFVFGYDTKAKKVTTYNIVSKQIVSYQLQGNIIRIALEYFYDKDYNTIFSDSGVKVTFSDNKENYYSFSQKKYLFENNITQITLLNDKYIMGSNNGKVGIISLDGIKNIPMEYDAINYYGSDYSKDVSYYEINNMTYFILAKNMKYGVVDEDNKIIVDFKYDNLFYSHELNKLYSNIYSKTVLFNEGEDELDEDDYDLGTDLEENEELLLKIDFYSLNGSYMKSVGINDNVRFTYYPTFDCNNGICYATYEFNRLDSAKYLRIYNISSSKVYDIDSNLELIVRTDVAEADCGIDSIALLINDYFYAKYINNEYIIYTLDDNKLFDTNFKNIMASIYLSDSYYKEARKTDIYLLCKEDDSECGAIDYKGDILVDFKYKLNDNYYLIKDDGSIININ